MSGREVLSPILLKTLLVVLSIICFSLLVRSQQATKEKQPPAPPIEQAKNTSTNEPIKFGSVEFSGSLRVRAENWNWFDTSAADPDYTFGAALLRLSFGQKTAKLDWQVEAALPLLINVPENSIAPAPQGQLGLGASYFAASGRQDGSVNLKQAFIRFKGIGNDEKSTLRFGRFEFVDGSETTPDDPTLATLKRDHIAHRLIGPFTFSHVGRSFDAVQYSRNTKTSNFTLLAARPTAGVFQLNANRELDVDFYYGAFTKMFANERTNNDARIFVLHYHDGRGALKTDNRTEALRRADTQNIRLTSIGGHYVGAIKGGVGTLDLLFWGVGQFGSWGQLDHRAGAIAMEAGYQFPGKIKPWLRGGYFRSTGDSNPNDGKHQTFFQVLPTPRIYARFPFYNLMNNEDTFVQLRLKPHQKVSLRADLRYLRLSNRNDLWYLGGGAFQENTFGYIGRPGGGNRAMGTVADISVDYNPTSKTTLTFYAGGINGGRVQGFVYPETGITSSGRFLYYELTQRF
jgi:Alginate export